MNSIEASTDAHGLRFAIVVARFNDFVTDKLLAGAIAALERGGAAADAVTVVHVPGSFEIPAAAQRAAETGEFDAVICLGCLIRGETPHFEYIASAAAHGITAAAAATGVPMAFGVLTTSSAEEALARAGSDQTNKGAEAARAAIEMAGLFKRLGSRPPGTRA